MTHKNENWLNPKGFEAFKLICSTLGIGLILAISYVAAFCVKMKISSPSPKASVVSPPPTAEATFEDLLDAIEWVESRGDANAVGDNGKAIGAYQIHKIYVDGVNRILKLQGGKVGNDDLGWRDYFTYKDRWDRDKSRAMVNIYLSYFIKSASWEYARKYQYTATPENPTIVPIFEIQARIHNGGPEGWKKKSTEEYWQKLKVRIVK